MMMRRIHKKMSATTTSAKTHDKHTKERRIP